MSQKISIFWLRRDLRLQDNAGLYYALRSGSPVLPVFIFDRDILDSLPEKKDKRVHFIHNALSIMQQQLVKKDSSLYILNDNPLDAFKKLIATFNVEAVYTNNDYEPYAKKRDADVAELLRANGISFTSFKDQVIFEKNEILKDNNEPYTVYTPYSRKWKDKLDDFYLMQYPTERYYANFLKCSPYHFPSLGEIGFENAPPGNGPAHLNVFTVHHYDKTRDFPILDGATKLSVHLRFGTVSIREIASQARALNSTLLNELIWREFYQMILWHFPHVVAQCFKKEYDKIEWRRNDNEFALWCEGKTGYPIVDAGMRQLNETGYMHNRVRMITASFLTKHLFMDWRLGEAYFAEKLLDYDLAANNGGWQWAAGTGCDAAPYFRIFNPTLQAEKFDPGYLYVKHWIPEFAGALPYERIVEHSFARERCLQLYKRYLNT